MRRYHTPYYPIWVITICIIFPSLLAAAIPATERAALIALYNSTDGDNWTNNSGWKTPRCIRTDLPCRGRKVVGKELQSWEIL